MSRSCSIPYFSQLCSMSAAATRRSSHRACRSGPNRAQLRAQQADTRHKPGADDRSLDWRKYA